MKNTLDDTKVKITILSFSFLFCVGMGICDIALAIGNIKKGDIFLGYAVGIAPALVCFAVAIIAAWIIIRDFFLKSAKRMRPQIVYRLIMGFAVGLIIMGAAFALTGCSKRKEPTRHPMYENFDIVTVTLSRNKGQVINNRYNFDWEKNCWQVEVKMQRESRVGDMVEKLLPSGLPAKIFYERELEKYVEAENKTD